MNNIIDFLPFFNVNGKESNYYTPKRDITGSIIILMLVIAVILFMADMLMHLLKNIPIGIGSYRIITMIVFFLFLLLLNNHGFRKTVKILLIFMPSVLFLIFPTFIGFVEEESFVYYPYAVIAFSVIPHVVLNVEKERKLYLLSLSYFTALLLVIDWLLIKFKPSNIKIYDIIQEFYVYYKLAPIVIFILLNAILMHFQNLNYLSNLHVRNMKNEMESQNEELKSIIDNLENTQQQLIQSEKLASLGTLIAGVTHELNNPLTYINGGIHVFQEFRQKVKAKLPDDFRETFDMSIELIKAGANEADYILKSLMSFSYREESRITMVDVHEVIDNTLMLLNFKILGEIGVIKSYRLNKSLPLYSDKIHQVLLNIFNNAIYELSNNVSSKDKRIIIETGIEQNHGHHSVASITISNTGSQIPSSIIHKIFDPFFTTKETGEGKGLGLAIAFSFVKEQNGELYAKNLEDGVAFVIEFPLNDVQNVNS